MSKNHPSVTKELFLSALTCPTQAWFLQNFPGRAPTPGEQMRMMEGQDVHERARNVFPNGIFTGNAESTTTILADPSKLTIFEAAFGTDGYAARADILQRHNGGFKVIEIKSSLHDDAKVDKDHIDDLAYTTMVLRRTGLPIIKAELLLLSRDFRLGMDNKALFISSDHTVAVLKRADEFLLQWDAVRDAILGAERPEPTLILECKKCQFFQSDCLGQGIEDSILELPRLSQKRFATLQADGIQTIDIIPDGYDLTSNQVRVVKAVKSGQHFIDRTQLRHLLKMVRFPACYLDFETLKTALPLWTDVAPHEQVVTQYSLHVCSSPGVVTRHVEYLAEPSRDCRRELVEKLIEDLDGEGSIIVYSSFEKTMLRGLATRFPDLAPGLDACINRLFDLEKVFKVAYYHPDFHGSTSIKSTLPVLVPELGYEGLTIHDGEMAMAAYARMARGECSNEELLAIKKSLLEYCAVDTMAMVRLHEALVRLPNVGT